MANGGTLPSNRTQTVTFYNTTPVIDKDKNVYFVPRLSKTNAQAGEQVRTAYLNAFAVVCPPSSAYTDIQVSQWSPQDRTLTVRGNIDDFRAVTDEGACLNYFIISRTVEKTVGETVTTQVFYYAFFITEVTQVGGSSVRITAVPDDFTNVFYLHNKHVLTQLNIDNDYEPFNEKMGNCYVARQHYDRVSGILFYSVYNLKYKPRSTWNVNVGDTIIISQPDISYGNFEVLSYAIDLEGYYNITLKDLDNSRATVTVPEIPFMGVEVVGGDSSVGEIASWTKDESQSTQSYNPANLKIFMNQEESFKFKYQYRDYKYPISAYDGLFTKEEIEAIEEAEDITDLSTELRDKVIYTCISYLVVETKSPEICKHYPTYNEATQTTYDVVLGAGEVVSSGINRTNPIICYPFINAPEVFNKFNLDKKIHFTGVIENFVAQDSPVLMDKYNQELVKHVIYTLNNNAVSDYVFSVYVVNDIGFPKELFNITQTSSLDDPVVYDIAYFLKLPERYIAGTRQMLKYGFYGAGLITNPADPIESDKIKLTIPGAGRDPNNIVFYSAGIMVSGITSKRYNIPLSVLGDIPSNLKLNYYDPVLEAEPYKFYTISSYANYELVFKKNRYYQTGTVDVRYYYSINGGVKVGYIPIYEVDEKSTPYYNEGLVFTVASSIPLSSDSYSSYYNQNRAQMKNQFAVAEKNFHYDILQHFFNSGPNAVGMSATKRGWVGAVSETGNQLSQMVDEHIDYVQSKEIIDMNQKAKLADVGASPDTLKQAGSDVIYDLKNKENHLFVNHYTIDDMSYNSNAKLLERVGYQVNLYDTLHVVDRVGWNYIQLIGFDWKPTVDIMTSQENSIRQIFLNGVTLLHDKNYLVEGHNYETLLD